MGSSNNSLTLLLLSKWLLMNGEIFQIEAQLCTRSSRGGFCTYLRTSLLLRGLMEPPHIKQSEDIRLQKSKLSRLGLVC